MLHRETESKFRRDSRLKKNGFTVAGQNDDEDSDDDETCLSRNNPLKDRFTIIQDYCECESHYRFTWNTGSAPFMYRSLRHRPTAAQKATSMVRMNVKTLAFPSPWKLAREVMIGSGLKRVVGRVEQMRASCDTQNHVCCLGTNLDATCANLSYCLPSALSRDTQTHTVDIRSTNTQHH